MLNIVFAINNGSINSNYHNYIFLSNQISLCHSFNSLTPIPLKIILNAPLVFLYTSLRDETEFYFGSLPVNSTECSSFNFLCFIINSLRASSSFRGIFFHCLNQIGKRKLLLFLQPSAQQGEFYTIFFSFGKGK